MQRIDAEAERRETTRSGFLVAAARRELHPVAPFATTLSLDFSGHSEVIDEPPRGFGDVSGRLLDVLANAITPALVHLFQPGEIDEVVVEALPPAAGDVRPGDVWHFAKGATHRGVWLEVRAGEDRFGYHVYQEESMKDDDTDAIRARLIDQLQDFIAESRFGWGELRPGP